MHQQSFLCKGGQKGEIMEEELLKIKQDIVESIEKIENKKDLNELKVAFLGKAGKLTAVLKGMRDVPSEDRPRIGVMVNEVRALVEEKIAKKEEELNQQELAEKLSSEKVDITMPSVGTKKGALHPVTSMTDRLVDICVNLGFSVVEGPEIESDYYNFEAVNTPKSHPARDMQDSFYFSDNILLRTQTTAVQARAMEAIKPPFKIVVPGKTYRNDSDATHSPMFNQLEGLVIDENVSMADLKIMLSVMMKRLFGQDTLIRFRPSYFPFTEPSIEVDVSCPQCHGQGCKLCKNSGYLELLGAGVVNPKVLDFNGIDSKKYKGFAFGFGIDRASMLFTGNTDMRSLFKNDIRFLKQSR